MFSYFEIMMISTIIITCSWIFATIHKIWQECFAGYLLITVFGLILILRTLNIEILFSWNVLYLILICFISVSIVIYSTYLRYKRKCK